MFKRTKSTRPQKIRCEHRGEHAVNPTAIATIHIKNINKHYITFNTGVIFQVSIPYKKAFMNTSWT